MPIRTEGKRLSSFRDRCPRPDSKLDLQMRCEHEFVEDSACQNHDKALLRFLVILALICIVGGLLYWAKGDRTWGPPAIPPSHFEASASRFVGEMPDKGRKRHYIQANA